MEIKEKLLYVLKILQDADKDSPVNAEDICRRLESEYGLKNPNRKGVYSDLAAIEKCGFHIVDSKTHKKGKYLEHQFSDAELKLMMDSVLTAKCLNVDDTTNVIEKLKQLSSVRGRKKFANLVTPRMGNKSQDRKAEEYLETILEAVHQGKQIEFQYTQFDRKMNRELRKDGAIYSFSVFSLSWANDTYYIIGMDDKHRELGNYRLDRVVNLKISTKKAIIPADEMGSNYREKIQNHIEDQVYHYGGQLVRLVLECEPNQREMNILYDFAGTDLVIRDGEDGKIIVSMDKSDSEALISWLMQYGHMFKVLEPEGVRERLSNRINSVEAFQNKK